MGNKKISRGLIRFSIFMVLVFPSYSRSEHSMIENIQDFSKAPDLIETIESQSEQQSSASLSPEWQEKVLSTIEKKLGLPEGKELDGLQRALEAMARGEDVGGSEGAMARAWVNEVSQALSSSTPSTVVRSIPQRSSNVTEYYEGKSSFSSSDRARLPKRESLEGVPSVMAQKGEAKNEPVSLLKDSQASVGVRGYQPMRPTALGGFDEFSAILLNKQSGPFNNKRMMTGKTRPNKSPFDDSKGTVSVNISESSSSSSDGDSQTISSMDSGQGIYQQGSIRQKVAGVLSDLVSRKNENYFRQPADLPLASRGFRGIAKARQEVLKGITGLKPRFHPVRNKPQAQWMGTVEGSVTEIEEAKTDEGVWLYYGVLTFAWIITAFFVVYVLSIVSGKNKKAPQKPEHKK